MNLSVLDIPEDAAPWLDRQLVGLQLDEMVAALEVVHARRRTTPEPTLDDVLGDHADDVLRDGLGSVPQGSLRRLLHHPQLLLELQERVLMDGSDYWRTLADEDAALAQLADEARPALRGRLGIAAPAEAAGADVIPFTPRPPRVGLIRAWAKMATIAASTLGFLYAANQPVVVPRVYGPRVVKRGAWGWNARDLAAVEPASTYLGHLADDANQWTDERPDDPMTLALRLGELRSGCTRLIVAAHPSLDDEDKAWLLERCRDWAGKLDDAVHALEGGAPAAQVRTDVDGIVRKLVDALRGRALMRV